LIVDGGSVAHGVESTVVDARGSRPILLRPGAITVEQLEHCTGRSLGAPDGRDEPRSPGTKYRHYSPRARLWLYPATTGDPGSAIQADALELRGSGSRVAAISRTRIDVDQHLVLPADARETARDLFAWMRRLDAAGMDYILIEGLPERGIGRTVMDRLRRAASRVRPDEPGEPSPA
jgi:L-threonylcarbamoyladenylate synthase